MEQKSLRMFAASVFALALIFFVWLWVFGPGNAQQKVTERGAFLMDTYADVKLVGKNSEEAAEALFSQLGAWERMLSAYLPGSDIVKVNDFAGEGSVQIDPALYALLKKTVDWTEEYAVSFDPTIGPLVDLWQITATNPVVPKQEEIDKAKALVNYKDLLFFPETGAVMLQRKGQKINLGAVAKGAADTLFFTVLQEYSVDSGYLSLGGNLFVRGKKEDDTPYIFGVRNPLGDSNSYFGTVALTDTTMATSGDYERFFVSDGTRYHHILDPATGYPAQSDLISVSVISQNGALADFLSTAFFIAGKDEILRYHDHPDFAYIAVDKQLNVYLSDGAKALFTLNENATEFSISDG